MIKTAKAIFNFFEVPPWSASMKFYLVFIFFICECIVLVYGLLFSEVYWSNGAFIVNFESFFGSFEQFYDWILSLV